MELPNSPNASQIIAYLRENPQIYELQILHMRKCAELGRSLTARELEGFKDHPNYCPEFLRIVKPIQKFFERYCELRLEGKAGLGIRENAIDQLKMIRYVLEEVINQGTISSAQSDEILIRYCNFVRAYEREKTSGLNDHGA